MTLARRISGKAQDLLARRLFRDEDAIGLVVDDRYEILGRIARGGMGEVFLARDAKLDRPLALKVLGLPGMRWSERSEAEARTLALLEHPGIVAVHDRGTFPDGRPYYTMQRVSGQTFEEVLRGGVPVRRLLALLAGVCEVVRHAHERGVLHRDLKPANIMVDGSDRVFVLDWGVARMKEELRRQGAVAGTVQYMAPEQARGDAGADERSDVYSLGAILFEILTGRPPVLGSAFAECLAEAAKGSRLRPSDLRPDVSPELESICRMAMAADPAARYPGARALAEDLARYLAGGPVGAHSSSRAYRLRKLASRRRGTMAAIAAAALLALGFVASAGHREAGLLHAAAERETRLRQLFVLWNDVVAARQEWYLAHKDPARTRAKVESAIAGLTRHLERVPGEPLGFYLRARGRLHLNDLDGARRDLEESIRLEPGFGPGWALLGRVRLEEYWRSLWSDGRTPAARGDARALALEAAAAAFAEARKADGRVSLANWGLKGLEEEEGGEVVVRALSQYASGDASGAIAALQEAHARAPSEECANLLGCLSPDPARNVAWQTEALRIRPHYAKATFDRAAALWDLGRFPEASEDFTRGLRLSPGVAGAFVGRAAVRAKLGNSRGAIEDATQALKIEPRLVQAYVNRAAARGIGGDYQGELEDASEALKLDPRSAQAHVNRSTAKWRLGDLQGGLADATEAVRLDPRDPLAWANRAGVRGMLRDFRGELEDASEALRLDTRLAGSFVNRAAARLHLGDLQGAADDASEALKLDPGSVSAHFNRSSARARLGDLPGAVEDATSVLRLDPNHALAFAYRGAAREALAARPGSEPKDLLRQAEEDLRKSLDLGGDGWVHRKATQDILERVRLRRVLERSFPMRLLCAR